MSERLNTQDLIDLLINRQGLERREAESFIKEFFSLIEEGLEKDKLVKIKGLGTFKLVNVESRESVNVNTGERIEIQGHTKISFTPDMNLRDIINKPFAHFETVILNDGVDFNDTAQDELIPSEPDIIDDTDISEERETETIPAESFSDSPDIVPVPEVESPEEYIKENIEETENTEVNEDTPMAKEIQKAREANAPDPKKEKESSNNKVLTLVIILTILLCGILLFFTYYSDIFPQKKTLPPSIAMHHETEILIDSIPKDSVEEPVILPATETNIEKPTDKPIPDKPVPDKTILDKPVADKPIAENTKRSNSSTIPFSQIPVKADSTSYEITGTKTSHTIKEGETLIRVSYRYYGTKDLWPYLVMHNRSTIKNPNSVPLGTKINVPELKKK